MCPTNLGYAFIHLQFKGAKDKVHRLVSIGQLVIERERPFCCRPGQWMLSSVVAVTVGNPVSIDKAESCPRAGIIRVDFDSLLV